MSHETDIEEVAAAVVGVDTTLVAEANLGLAATFANTGAGVETSEPVSVISVGVRNCCG